MSDSRVVFITYIVSLTVCYTIYEVSSLLVMHPTYTKERLHSSQAHEEAGGTPLGPLERVEDGVISQSTATNARSSRAAADTSTTQATLEDLVEELRKAAQLRRDSAAADERIAQLYERLAQK
jgi:hypothetical protein